MLVDGDHVLDSAELAPPHRAALGIEQTLERAHDISGEQRPPVRELGVLAQPEDIAGWRALLPRLSKLRRRFQIVRRAHQSLVDEIEDRPRRAIAGDLRIDRCHLGRLSPGQRRLGGRRIEHADGQDG